jgi:hypothetical protein
MLATKEIINDICNNYGVHQLTKFPKENATSYQERVQRQRSSKLEQYLRRGP